MAPSSSTQAQDAPAAPKLPFGDVRRSADCFFRLAAIEVLQDMMEQDARKAHGDQ
jgi:hypothetical protein